MTKFRSESRRLAPSRKASSPHHRRRMFLESLEERSLLATLYWDPDGNSGNNNYGTGAGLGGTGVWDSAATNWVDGGGVRSAWNSANNDDAIFTGTAGDVTYLSGDSAVTANSLTFNSTGYNLWSGISPLTVTSGNVTVNTGTATIDSALAGANGLNKGGVGTLEIGNTNTYTGGTNVNGGTLKLTQGERQAYHMSLTNLTNNVQGYTGSLGYDFQVPAGGSVTITDLGIFDYQVNGLALAREARIYDIGTQALLASATVPAGTATPLNDGYRFVPLGTPLTLTAGNYTVVWHNPGNLGDDPNINTAIAGPSDNAGQFNFIGSSRYAGAPMSFPTNADANIYRYGAASFKFLNTNVAQIPAASTVTVAAGATLDLNGLNGSAAGLIGGAGSVVTLGAGTLTLGGSGTQSFSGVISGAGGVTYNGTGVQILSGANTYSGNTTVNSGVLRLGSANSIPDGPGKGNVVVSQNGTLDLAGFSETINGLSGAGTVDTSTGAATITVGAANTSSQFNGSFTNSGGTLSFAKTGAGTFTLGKAQTYGGSTNIADGIVTFQAVGQAYQITANSVSNQAHGGSLGYTFVVNVGQTVTVTDLGFYDSQQNGLATSHNVFISNETGPAVVATAVVPAGTAGVLSAGYRFVTLGAPIVLNAGTYRIWGDNYGTDGNYNTGGPSAGPTFGGSNGQLTFAGNSYYNLAPNAYPTTQDGTNPYRYGAASFKFIDTPLNFLPVTTDLTVSATGTLNLSGGNQTVATLSGPAGGQVIGGGGSLTVSGAANSTFGGVFSGSGGLTRAGTGRLTLTSPQTYTGNTSVTGGTLQLGAANILPDGAGNGNLVTAAGGILDLAGFNETVNGLSGAGTITNSTGAATFTFGGNNVGGTFDGFFTDSGGTLSISKIGTGTQYVSQTQTYGGGTNVADGILSFGITVQAYQITTNTGGGQSYGGTLGYDFTVQPGRTAFITELGFYDAQLDGLATSHNVFISTSGGATVLASAVVPAGLAAPLSAGYRFIPLAAPVLLGPGTYTVWGNDYSLDQDYNTALPAGPTDAGPNGDITFVADSGKFGPANTYPTSAATGAAHRFGAASFRFQAASAGMLPATTDVTLGAAATLRTNGGSAVIRSLNGPAGAQMQTGDLTINGPGLSNYAGTLAAAKLTKGGTGTLVLGGVNSHTSTVIQGGVLAVNSDAALGVAPANPAVANIDFTGSSTLRIDATINPLNVDRRINIAPSVTATIDTNGNNLQFTGYVQGGGSLVKSGAGTLTLGGNNYYTGDTTVSGGVLTYTQPTTGGTQAYTATNTNGGQSYGGTLGYDFTIAPGRSVTVTELGFYDAQLNGLANSHNVFISTAGGASVLATAVVPAGVAATLSGGYRFIPLASPLLLGPGTYTVWGNDFSVDQDYNTGTAAGPTDGGPNADIIFVANSGKFGPANTYPNTAAPGVSHRFGAVSFKFQTTYFLPQTNLSIGAAGTLNAANFALTAASLSGPVGGQLQLGGGAFTVNGAATTQFDGAVSGAGGFIKRGTGTQVLGGTNTYNGATDIIDGVLTAANNSALGNTTGVTNVVGGTLGLQGGVTIPETILADGAGFGGLGAIRNISGLNTISGTVSPAATNTPFVLQNGTAFHSQGGFSPDAMIDGNLTPSAGGWANSALNGNDAVFETAANVNPAGTATELLFSILSGGYGNHTLGRFRLYVTNDNRANFADGLDNGGLIGSSWVALTPDSAVSSALTPMIINGDNSILVNGAPNPETATYTIRATTTLANITGVRLEAMQDPSLPSDGPGRATNGNYVVIEWTVAPNSYDLTIGSDAGRLSFTNTVSASLKWNMNVLGAGDVAFNANLASPNLPLVKSGVGRLDFNSNHSFTGTVTVNGGSVGGTGTITAPVQVNSGAAVSPGNSPGVLNTGSTTFAANSSYNVEINGTAPGAFDQLNVTGTVNISNTNTTLNISGTHTPAPGDSFTVITASGGRTGQFSTPVPGATILLNGGPLEVVYPTPNTVVLQYDTTPSLGGTAGNDNFRVYKDAGNNVVLELGGVPIFTTPISAISGLVIDAGDGDDTLTVDFTVNGSPIPGTGLPGEGILFNGQNSTLPNPGDVLIVLGDGTQAITNLPSASIAGDGVLNFGGGKLVTYTGLEPIDIIAAASYTLITPNAADVVAVADGVTIAPGPAGGAALVVSGTSNGVPFESVNLRNVTTVTIDTATNDAGPADAVTLTSGVGAHGNVNLTIDTGAGADTVTVAGAITVAGNVNVASGTIALNSLVTAGAASTVTLTATGAITTNGPAADIAAANVALTATTGVGTALNPLNTAVANLEALTQTGGVFISNTGALSIGNVDGALGGVDVIASGDISLVATGSINVSLVLEDVFGPGNITLDAQGATSDVNTGTAGGFGAGSIYGLGATSLVSVTAGRDVNVGTATALDYGDIYSNGSLLITAGRDFTLRQFSFIDVYGPGTNTINAGRDILLLNDATGSRISTQGGLISLTAQRHVSTNVLGAFFATIDSTQAGTTPAGANVSVVAVTGDISLGDEVNAGTSGSVTLTAGGAILDLNGGGNNVFGVSLIASAVTGIDLDTTMTNLTATNSGAGSVNLDELDGANVLNVSAANGAATVTSATGDLNVTSVSASGNVTLTATAGAITDANGAGTLNVSGALLDATALNTINLDTSVTSLTAATTNAAMVIREASAVAVNTVNAGTSTVALAAGGAVTDGNAALNNVTAASLLVTAAGGIALDTTVGQLAASNATSGDIVITNTGALNITTLSEVSIGSVSGVLNPAGAVTVTALSPLTVSSPVSALGAVVLTATDSAAAGDDLTVNATVTSTGSSVTLNAGDNATINATLSALTTVAINIDAGDLDPLVGATLNIPTGVVITATSATFTGGTQADAFNFAPQASTPINVSGLAPFANPGGDTMLLDTAAPVTNPTLNILGGQGAGLYTFGNRANVQYASIESANTTTPIHVSLDATATLVENIRLQRSSGGGIDFEVYDTDTTNLLYAAPIVNVLSFTFLGSVNPNTVAIDDVNGLVDLAGAVPGATGVGDNTNVTGTPEVFLRGNGGTDAIVFANTANATDQIYGFGTGAAPGSQAGEVYTTNAALALSVYFDGMEGVTSNDATPADVGTLTIVGDAAANVISLASSAGGTIVSATGYVPFTFAPQAFNAAIVNAGDNDDSLTLVSLNAAESGLALSLNGQIGNDTISVETASVGNTLALQGGTGNDAYLLGGAANTVDNILVPITITDTSGTDSLTLNDSADLSGDTVTITDSTIDGVNGAPSPNVSFSLIEALDVTTSGGGDTITTTLNGLSNLVTVNVRGAGGDDDFFLNTADGMATLTTINLIGDAGSDDFGSAMTPIRPLAGPATNVWIYGDTTAITTNPGGAITDRLFLDMTTTSAGTPTLPLVIVDTVTGQATTANTRLLRFGGIDDIDLYDGGVLTDVAIGDLYLRATDGVDNLVFYRENGGVFVKRNGVPVSATPYAPTNRIVSYGRAGNDYMEFNFTLGSTLSADFRGENDNDTLVGGLGSDLLVGGGANDVLRGGEGNDVLYGEDQFLTTSPMSFADQRRTGLVLSAVGGNDTLEGGGGNDFLFGGTGADNLTGGLGNDYVHGGEGNDTLNSGGGNDILRGMEGADLINGAEGNDILLGGAGDDRIFGRGNRDFLLAGAGADQIQDDEASNDVVVAGGLVQDGDDVFTSPTQLSGLNDYDLALQALMFTGPNAWSGAAPFATRVANLTPLTAIINDTVADIILGNVGGQDYIISNTNDMRLNTAGDQLLTV